jgi:hypothetical protein
MELEPLTEISGSGLKIYYLNDSVVKNTVDVIATEFIKMEITLKEVSKEMIELMAGYDVAVAESSISSRDTLDVLRSAIPGFQNMMVKYPIDGEEISLYSAIMCLNDTAGWSREAIADWLETLDLDLSIKTPKKMELI